MREKCPVPPARSHPKTPEEKEELRRNALATLKWTKRTLRTEKDKEKRKHLRVSIRVIESFLKVMANECRS